MVADLAALAPSVLVGVAFLVGVGWLVRHEMAPRRRAGADVPASPSTGAGPREAEPETGPERGDGSQT
jgi:hypothetical protein